ncbi:hypothetical protein OXIME_001230 [Oxyplasma meridianum]|uniref:Restriction endonuclease n=1 Tax=Oxyplasma meridianum TaxID=3073602 RepID=A0AAX4NHU6_9ARCH
MVIPKKLEEIRKYLIESNMELSNSFADGRVNSRINEDEVIRLIRGNFSINVPKSRAWYDFSFEETGIFYPVNIKITETTSADNLNCKLGIYYALTGKIPDFPNEIDWLDYFEKLKTNLSENSKDYYFLVINRSNTTDIFINSLKSLTTLQPNGNNLPFQCKWGINRIIKVRDYEDAKKFILKNFGESIRLRAEIFFIFKRLFNEYLR